MVAIRRSNLPVLLQRVVAPVEDALRRIETTPTTRPAPSKRPEEEPAAEIPALAAPVGAAATAADAPPAEPDPS